MPVTRTGSHTRASLPALEDAALARYRMALEKDALPAAIRVVVERQAQGAQRNHEQVKALRDAVKAAR